MNIAQDREQIMLTEELDGVPEDVRVALRRRGFVPTLDAGNLWFYDRGNLRLVFGEDGSDLPRNLGVPVAICRKDAEDYAPREFASLADALDHCVEFERFFSLNINVGDWQIGG